MDLKKLTGRVYYLPAEERTDRPVLGYIRGDNFSLAVDAGNSPDHVGKFYKNLSESGLKLPDFTIITHWHWDHTFGMQAVTGKTVACHQTNQKLNEVQKWDWTDEAMARRLQSGEDIDFCDSCIKLEYPDRNQIKVVTAEIGFVGGINIDLGGIHAEIRELKATHSPDSVLVQIPEDKVLFLGDADCADFYGNRGLYDKPKLTEMIRELEKIGADIFMGGHDIPQSKREVISFLKGELAALRE
jgi:glyoxylase-like metal-dependent hydrolase (beta-lactamase superfamily II)